MTELPKDYQNMEIVDFVTLGLDAKPWELTHKDVLNLEIVVYVFGEIDTRFGKGMLATCMVDGEVKKILIGGKVLIRQLEAMKDTLPVRTTVVKSGRYYTFS